MHIHVPSLDQKHKFRATPIKQHVNTARCTQPYARTQTDACTLEDAQTPSFGGLWCGGCMMRMMMKALLYYAACCHYPTLQTEPDRGPSSSTIPAVNIHVIAQQQLSGKIRSVITEVNLSQSLIRSIRVVSIHDQRGTIKDGPPCRWTSVPFWKRSVSDKEAH